VRASGSCEDVKVTCGTRAVALRQGQLFRASQMGRENMWLVQLRAQTLVEATGRRYRIWRFGLRSLVMVAADQVRRN
jgi:hypothetical protein